MKKVLHIPNYFPPHIGGIEKTSYDVVCSLKGLYEQKVICFNQDKETVYDNVDGIDVIRVGSKMKVFSQSIAPDYKKELKKVFKEFNPDIVIFHYPNPYVSHFLLKQLKKSNAKLVLYWHLDIVKQKVIKLFFEAQNEKLLHRANKIIATSANYIEGSKYLSKFKSKCEVINSISSIRKVDLKLKKEKINEIKKDANGKKIIFSFGRLVKHKGFNYLIEASKYIKEDVVIYIGGDGPMFDELLTQAKDYPNVKLVGRLDDYELEAYFECASLFAFPSYAKNEAFGLALVEAQLHGLSSVTFKIEGSGVSFVNLNNFIGIEVENRNVKAFANAITRIVTNDELNKTFSSQAKKRSEELFTYDVFSKNIKNLVSKL